MYKILYYDKNEWKVLAEKYPKQDTAKEWAGTFKEILNCRTKVIGQEEAIE